MDDLDLKKLDRFISLCRKRGVSYIKTADGFEMSLGEAPMRKDKSLTRRSPANNPFDVGVIPAVDNSAYETDELTEEQLIEWSVSDPSANQ